MSNIRLLHPQLLWLLLLLVPLIVWHVLKWRERHPSLRVSSTVPFAKTGRSWKEWLTHIVFALEMMGIACVVVILCRPQARSSWASSSTQGTDIVIALDVSTSMLAKDFSPDRLAAAKDVAMKFAAERENDNIGLVIFASETFTQSPLTGDKAMLVNLIGQVQIGLLDDGTAIGDGIATAINRIKDGKAKSKSIILLTDGSNNTGQVAPITAAKIAAEKGIKVYTIGVGTNGTALFPVATGPGGNIQYERLPVEIDENTLRQISKMTGGTYFRATSKSVLRDIFKEIDKLEKSSLDIKSHTNLEDAYEPWALALLLLVIAVVVLRYTALRRLP